MSWPAGSRSRAVREHVPGPAASERLLNLVPREALAAIRRRAVLNCHRTAWRADEAAGCRFPLQRSSSRHRRATGGAAARATSLTAMDGRCGEAGRRSRRNERGRRGDERGRRRRTRSRVRSAGRVRVWPCRHTSLVRNPGSSDAVADGQFLLVVSGRRAARSARGDRRKIACGHWCFARRARGRPRDIRRRCRVPQARRPGADRSQTIGPSFAPVRVAAAAAIADYIDEKATER